MYFRFRVVSAIQASPVINSPYDGGHDEIRQAIFPAGIGYTGHG
jgi:hypothetical protein